MKGDLTLDEHTILFTDDVLLNCTPEAYTILLIKSLQQIQKKNKIKQRLTELHGITLELAVIC